MQEKVLTSSRLRFAVGVMILLAVFAPACRGEKSVSTEPAVAPPAESAGADAPAFVAVPAEDLPRPESAIPASASTAEPPPYVVAAEDVLEISIYGDPEMTRQIPVRPDGMISYTFVGDVKAAGRTIEEIRVDLKEKLGTYLRTPEVTVIAREFGRQKVYVGGEVRQPGVFYLTPRENTVADVVFRAGLSTEKADLSRAVLVRGGGLVPIDFARMVRGDMSGNVVMQGGDLIYVPEAAERYIYVLGEVRNQNAIETTIPLTILNVITRAGGVNPGTAKSREIAVLRGSLREPQVAVVNWKRLVEGDFSQNITVKPGDIVYVPTTALGKYNQFIEQILRTFTLLFQGRVVQQGFN